jgi:biopolymer transport protein ExbB
MTAMSSAFEHVYAVLQRGGWVMVPLTLLSLFSLTLIMERAWFWLSLHRGSRLRMLRQLNEALRSGDRAAAQTLIRLDRSPYAEVAGHLLQSGATQAVAIDAVETQRPKFERFMILLSTIITAAPMLGILGTVTGIIQSFRLLGENVTLTDPRLVSGGIAEALITTAAGLVIALLTLFPYTAFRGQAERAMGRMETIIAAAQQGEVNSQEAVDRKEATLKATPSLVKTAEPRPAAARSAG